MPFAGRTFAAVALLATAAFSQLGGARSGNKWAKWEHEMQDPVDDPPDALRKAEFAFTRLRYRSSLDGRRFGGYARWGIDCNKGDRLFIQALTRLTRIDVQPIETIIDVDDDELYHWPWLFAVSAGDWRLSKEQAKRLRAYFDRGGFLMVDDFHNDREWASFMEGIHQIDPEAEAIELEDPDTIFHVLYDMKDRVRVPGANVVHGSQIERGGTEPHWRAILDKQGRVMVVICFNMDVGDGWEFADDPEYPQKLAYEALRLGANYVVYALTH